MTITIGGPMRKSFAWFAFSLALAVAAGCSQSNPAPYGGSVSGTSSPEGAKYLLAAEPPGAKPVKEMRQSAKD